MDDAASNTTPPPPLTLAPADPTPNPGESHGPVVPTSSHGAISSANRTSSGDSVKRRRVLPYLLLMAILAPSAVWVALDRSVWSFDQSWYGEVSVDLYGKLGSGSDAWFKAMRTMLSSKPPGIAWLGQWFVPAGLALGRIETALLASVLLCQFGTLVLVYRTGRLLAPDRPLIAIVGSLMIGAAPLFVSMSHNYFAEPLQTFAVAWVFYIASRGPGASRVRSLAELIAVATLGMLAKTTTPLYCLLAGLLGIAWMVRSRRPDVRRAFGATIVDWGALALSLAFAAGAATWFAHNAEKVIEHVRIASSGDASLLYGSSRPFLAKLQFWGTAMQRSFWLEPLMWILAAGAALALALYGVRTRRRRLHRGGLINLVALVALLQVVAVVCVLALNVNEEPRYLLPLVVPIAIVLMWTLAQFPDWSLASVWCVLLGGQWVCVFLQAFGGIAVQPTMTHWLKPIERDAGRSDELARVVEATSHEDVRDRINVIGVEYPWLNANSASFYVAKAALSGHPRCYFTSLGYAETKVEAAWTRMLQTINAPYFISVDEAHRPPSDAFNVVSLPILKRAETDPSFAREPFDSNFGIVIFRRMDARASQ